jgi:transposase
MNYHRNARLTVLQRRELALMVEGGSTVMQAAVCFNVAPATAHRWSTRWRAAPLA